MLRTCGNASTGCACDTPVLAFAREHGGAGKKKNEQSPVFQFECVLILLYGVVNFSVAIELVGGPDKWLVIEELPMNLGDCIRMCVDKLRDVRRAVGRREMRQEHRGCAIPVLVNMGEA